RNLAGWLGLDPSEVGRAVAAARGSAARAPEQPGPSRRGGEAPSESPAEAGAPEIRLMDLPTDPVTRGERDALMAVGQHPGEVGRELLGRLARVRRANATLAVVRDALAAALAERPGGEVPGEGWAEAIAGQAPPGFAGLVSQLAVAPIPQRPDQLGVYCRGVV